VKRISTLVLALALHGSFASTSTFAEAKYIAAAVTADARPDADKKRDADRKPGRTLEFFKIQPGQSVLDVAAGGGYYTELAARAVGPSGSVTAFNVPAEVGFVGKQIAERNYAKRLPNVTELTAEANDVDFGDNKYDRILFVQGYHDLYLPEGQGWKLIDAPAFRKKLYRALKPGGVLGVVDHVAATGAPEAETAVKLHRIDPKNIIVELEATGFRHQAFGGFLRNTTDKHDLTVFDPKVRGKTDQVVLKFRKPK
jgi:predicted methyltransferase